MREYPGWFVLVKCGHSFPTVHPQQRRPRWIERRIGGNGAEKPGIQRSVLKKRRRGPVRYLWMRKQRNKTQVATFSASMEKGNVVLITTGRGLTSKTILSSYLSVANRSVIAESCKQREVIELSSIAVIIQLIFISFEIWPSRPFQFKLLEEPNFYCRDL